MISQPGMLKSAGAKVYISRKCILPNMIGAVTALMIFTAPIIFGKMHFLLISEHWFFHEIKRDGMTSLHGIHDFIDSLHNYVI